MDKLCCLKEYQNKVQRLRQTCLFRRIKDRLVIFSQIIAGNTQIFLNYLEQKKTSSPERITWMVVGLTESVAIITLNSLTVIAFCRDRNLRKRSTYLVISLAVADMISGGTSTLELFYNVGGTCMEGHVTSGGTIHCLLGSYHRSLVDSNILFMCINNDSILYT